MIKCSLTPTLVALCFCTALWLLTLPLPAPAQWTNDPYNGMVPVCTAPAQQTCIRMSSLAGGHTLIAWVDERTNPEKGYYQVLDTFGNALRTLNGDLIIDGTWLTAWPYAAQSSLIQDGEGGCILVFEDYRIGFRQIYGQRFDSLGNPLWGATGLPLAIWPGGEVGLKDVEKDSLGNGFVAWAKNTSPINAIYVQKFNLASGQCLWGPYGIMSCGGIAQSDYQQIVPDGHGGVYDAWADTRSGWEDWHLYAQHLDAAGNALWRPNGIPIRNPISGSILPGDALTDGITDGLGGGIWVFNPPIPVVCSFRLLPSGAVAWLITDDIYIPIGLYAMLRHPADGTIWMTCGANWPISMDYYILRIAPRTGAAYFGEEGLPWGGSTMVAVSDGVITFASPPGYWGNQSSRLSARRVNASGTLVWQTHVALSGPLPNHLPAFGNIKSVSDGAYGAICAWEDRRNYPQTNFDIYAQRVRNDGQLGSPTPPAQQHPGGQIANPPPAD